jgi:hypothetical protein
MQVRHWILIASLIANAAILAAMVGNSSTKTPAIGATDGSKTTQSTGPTSPLFSKANKSGKPSAPDAAPDSAAPAFHWSQIESEDYKRYIANLRAAGCPEKTIRDIILADLQKLYQPRLAALRAKPNEKYWERSGRFGPYPQQTKEQREQTKAIQNEIRDLAKTLLGSDVYEKRSEDAGYPAAKGMYEQVLGPLPDDKKEALQKMNEQFNDTRNDLYAKADGMIDQDTQAAVRDARRKFREQLSTILTPEQVAEYELHYSDTSSNLKYELKGFEPTEAEFRAMFKYRQTLEDATVQPTPDAPPNPDTVKQLAQAKKAAEDEMNQALGPDRVKEYKMVQDYSYRSLSDMGVSRDDLLKVVDFRTAAEDAVRKLQQDKSLSAEDRQAAYKAVAEETQNQLNGLIGERKAKYYANQGGFWIRSLSSGAVSRPSMIIR